MGIIGICFQISDMLSNLTDPLFTIHALDILPKNTSASALNNVLNKSQM